MSETYTIPVGQRPKTRQQSFAKFVWIGVWLAFMGAPVSDLIDGGHAAGAVVLGALGLVAFVAAYLTNVFRHTSRMLDRRGVAVGLLGFQFVLAVVLPVTMGTPWLVLFVYVSVSAGAALPLAWARVAIPVATGVMFLVGFHQEDAGDLLTALVFPALLGGFAMSGVRQLVRTTVELREARATVAELAANEERLRLARDLHDLLGHSLSLITLKSELAGRMLPVRPDKAAEQIADIERVSRQALTDVREAVTGYRRPTLPGELAGARTALAVAGITPDLPAEAPCPSAGGELSEECEAALAWSLREAVTNVVRHSGARRCVVALTRRETLDGPYLELTVEDDGQGGHGGRGGHAGHGGHRGQGGGGTAVGGAAGAAHGNGLTGLSERLTTVGGALETDSSRRGFLLTARVPIRPRQEN